jgi:glutathione S-transferase
MSMIKLIQMYASPWAERVRWALRFKDIAYEKQNYQPGVDEEYIKKLTGQAQVPVLVADDRVIPDSTAIMDWLEEYKSQPSLLPVSDGDRAQVIMWEELIGGILGPQARMLIIGSFLRSGQPELQDGGRYFSAKYQHSEYAEKQAEATVKRILTVLKHGLTGRQYLVGEAFSRADLIAASMLLLLSPPPDDLFVFPAPLRPRYTMPLSLEPAFVPIFQWRNDMYRKHRGEIVTP